MCYKSSHVYFGAWGEQFVRDTLRHCGLMCDRSYPGDLHSGDVTIEVKTARPTRHTASRRLRHQFCIERYQGYTLDADYLVLVLCTLQRKVTDVYVIPRSCVKPTRKIVIPSADYRGRYAAFRDAWERITSDRRCNYVTDSAL